LLTRLEQNKFYRHTILQSLIIIAIKMGGVNWILPVTSRGIAPTIFSSI